MPRLVRNCRADSGRKRSNLAPIIAGPAAPAGPGRASHRQPARHAPTPSSDSAGQDHTAAETSASPAPSSPSFFHSTLFASPQAAVPAVVGVCNLLPRPGGPAHTSGGMVPRRSNHRASAGIARKHNALLALPQASRCFPKPGPASRSADAPAKCLRSSESASMKASTGTSSAKICAVGVTSCTPPPAGRKRINIAACRSLVAHESTDERDRFSVRRPANICHLHGRL